MSIIKKIINFKPFSRFKGESGIFAFLLLSLFSCVDDKLVVEEPGDPDSQVAMQGDALTFTIELDKSLTTRARITGSDIEAKDDWIDTQDKFRVFFFTKDGDFLFGANDRVVGAIENVPNNSNAKGYWYVRIPMTMIVDRDNKEYDIAKIKAYLKNNPFKVAVLANWPNAGDKINPSDYDDSSDNSFKQNPSSSLKGEPLWGWKNSVLNEDADPDSIRNINDLHHIYNDTYYQSLDNVYSAFMNEYEGYEGMGQPTDWVQMRDISEGWHPDAGSVPAETFDSKETANQWIRAYWNPELTLNEDKHIYRHYQHLWFLWNFNAIYNIGRVSDRVEAGTATAADLTTAQQSYYGGNYNWNDGRTIGRTTNKWGEKWWERNGAELYEWMRDKDTNSPKTELKSYSLKNKGNANNSAYLSFVAPENKNTPAKVVNVRTTAGNSSYGILLPAMSDTDEETGNANTADGSSGYFKFIARTSGTIRVRWGNASGDKKATLAIQADEDLVGSYSIGAGHINEVYNTRGEGATLDYLDISVPADSKDIYIWTKEGDAIIYAIEFIRGKYLYDTDREGVAPNIDQGIPMYGVQQYDAIPDWEYGSTYNLSENSKNVSLIRALAKVELFIPTDFGLPKHVYMRCMNRTAHCEPMDVETNTGDLWNEDGNHEKKNETSTVNDCEWFNIQKYSPAYKVSEDYQKYLSWFYGSWQYTHWTTASREYISGLWTATSEYEGWKKFSDWATDNIGAQIYSPKYAQDESGGNGDNGNSTNTRIDGGFFPSNGYPHLFNPHMNRSEFCSFLHVGEINEGGYSYNKYVLYVPDKFINDPYEPGKLTSIPKVPHIEFRFSPSNVTGAAMEADIDYYNTEFNLDDNDCYRVYFTNYGYDSSTTSFNQTPANTTIREYNKTNYDNYEQSVDHLKQHWPIMRNHKYQFYVSSAGPSGVKLHARVMDWSHEKVVVDW